MRKIKITEAHQALKMGYDGEVVGAWKTHDGHELVCVKINVDGNTVTDWYFDGLLIWSPKP